MLFLSLVFGCFVSVGQAGLLLPQFDAPFEVAVAACEDALEETATVCNMTFGHHASKMSCWCGTDTGFESFLHCFVTGYHNKTSFIDKFIQTCEEEANVTFTTAELWAKYDRLLPELKETLEIEDFNITKFTGSPIKMDPTLQSNVLEDTEIASKNKNYSQYFGYGLMAYWAVVLLTAAVVNWTIELFPGVTGTFVAPVFNNFRKYVTLPATFRRRKTHAVRFGFLIPSRMETVILTVFVFLVALFSGLYIRAVPGYGNNTQTLAQLTAIRTGILVGFLCPFLVLFAGRNNFLQWLTRWNFATFIAYHRWVSRVVALLVIIHAIAFTISDLLKDHYKSHMNHPFVQWGVVAGICGGFILVQGLLYVRRRNYEVFLAIHIILALFFIVGGYKHTIVFGFGPYYWASIAIWAFDRAIRFSRLIVFGAPVATVTLLAEETLRVVIPKPSYWHAIPGGHAFIHFLKPTCFWQSHPFTFTDSSEEGGYIVMYIKLKGGVTHGIYKYLSKFPGKSSKIRVLVEGPYGERSSARRYKNAVFVAGGNGIPGIYSECIDIARKTGRQAGISGPSAGAAGTNSSTSGANAVPSAAGTISSTTGTDITATGPSGPVTGPSGPATGPRLKLIWILREYKSLSWFFHELKVLNTTNIDTTIYITKPSTEGLAHFKGVIDSDSSSNVEKMVEIDEKKDKVGDVGENVAEFGDNDYETKGVSLDVVDAIKEELSHITFKEGRPNMEELVGQEISQSDGSIAFVACGHPVMVDDIRASVAENLGKSKYRVEYFEQLQVWA